MMYMFDMTFFDEDYNYEFLNEIISRFKIYVLSHHNKL